MASCQHVNLELLPIRKRTMRCRRCHLTMDGAELGDGHCPECFETTGVRRYDFEQLDSGGDVVTYRCEECGAIIKCS